MQAERHINRKSVTSVTSKQDRNLLEEIGGTCAEAIFPLQSQRPKPGDMQLCPPAIFLVIAFEQDHLLMWEWDLDPRLIKGFLDQFRDRKAHVEPVLAFDKWTCGEID